MRAERPITGVPSAQSGFLPSAAFARTVPVFAFTDQELEKEKGSSGLRYSFDIRQRVHVLPRERECSGGPYGLAGCAKWRRRRKVPTLLGALSLLWRDRLRPQREEVLSGELVVRH